MIRLGHTNESLDMAKPGLAEVYIQRRQAPFRPGNRLTIHWRTGSNKSFDKRRRKGDCVRTCLAYDVIETAAVEGEILRRSSVRSSIRKRMALPVDQEDWDARADGFIAMLFDARNQKPSPLVQRQL